MDMKRILVIGVFILLIIVVLLMFSKTRPMVSGIVSKVPVVGTMIGQIPTAL